MEVTIKFNLEVAGKILKWSLKVSYFQNEFMKTKLLPKNEQKIARISAL